MNTAIPRLQQVKTVVLRRLPSSVYVRLLYLKYHHRLLSLRNPQGFTEKLQWLKLHGQLDQLAPYVDKYDVRAYVAETVGESHLIPLLGVWDRAEDIPFETLPNQFVLKATHGCGYNIICEDKAALDVAATRVTLDGWLKENFYWFGREPQYRACRPKIVAEAYLEDDSGGLRDYKFWCSHGKAQIIQVDVDRFVNHASFLLDTDWHKREQQAASFVATDADPVSKPAQASELVAIAEQLAAAFPFVRVDLYLANNTVYFGELTFTPGSGLVSQQEWSDDVALGRLIDINDYRVRQPRRAGVTSQASR